MISCSICARGGSQGVKNKNIRLINGRPLIEFTIRQAIQSQLFDVIAVSSDSPEILAIAKKMNVQVLVERPSEMAQNVSPKLPVIKHALEKIEQFADSKMDIVVDLDCTSPLRNIDDIRGVIDLLKVSQAPNIITGSTARRSPYFNLVELKGELPERGLVTLSKPLSTPVVRRQDVPLCFDMNASIYAWTREGLLSSDLVLREGTQIYMMPEERSLDIDSEFDFKIVEFLMKERSDLC